MKWDFLRAAIVVVIAASSGTTGIAADNDSPLVKKGQYIARATDCLSCHVGTDGTPFAGGKPISTPLGDVVAPNISSSKKYGIGKYSVEDLTKVLRDGKTSWFRHLYPAMPYPAYHGMTDEDIHALYAYLQTVQPVERKPEAETDLDFPFNIRSSMIVWNALNLGKNYPQQKIDDQALRGRYIVDNMAHCGTCHTPRNAIMGSDFSQYLGGAQLGSWYAPNITSDTTAGVGAWSIEKLVNYLKNGQADYVAQAAGPMAEAVHYSLKYLKNEDLTAIASYLKTVPAIANTEQKKPLFDAAISALISDRKPEVTQPTRYASDELAEHGLKTGAIEKPGSASALYAQQCASCHGVDGFGQPDSFYASLNGNTTLRSTNPRNVVAVIFNGVAINGATPRPLMPGFESKLDNQAIAILANYVRTEFGGHATSNISAEQVAYINSGKQPISALIRYAPLLAWLSIVVLVILIFSGIWFWWDRRRRTACPQIKK